MLKYFGENRELQRKLKHRKKELEYAYLKLLGPGLFQHFQKCVENLITPVSFFSIEELGGITRMQEVAVSPANKFLIAEKDVSVAFESNGSFAVAGDLVTCPAFFFHAAGFSQNSRMYSKCGVPPDLGSLIHEYNHFLLYLLQKTPFTELLLHCLEFLRVPAWPLTDELMCQFILSYYGDLPKQEIANRLLLGFFVSALYWANEISVRAIDETVFKSLGFKPRGYFNYPKKTVKMLTIPELNAGFGVATGDPFYGFDIKSRLERILDWPTYFRPSNFIQENFLRSARTVNFIRIPFTSQMRDELREQIKTDR